MVRGGRNILHKMKRPRGYCFGHILRWNCILKHVIEGKVEGARRRRRRYKQLPDYFKENRGYFHYIALCGELVFEETMYLS
jgi:hypothetical protein